MAFRRDFGFGRYRQSGWVAYERWRGAQCCVDRPEKPTVTGSVRGDAKERRAVGVVDAQVVTGRAVLRQPHGENRLQPVRYGKTRYNAGRPARAGAVIRDAVHVLTGKRARINRYICAAQLISSRSQVNVGQ